MNIFNYVELSHFIIDNYVKPGDVVVDATSGNGFDTLYLCNQLQGKGFLYSFDIQSEAILRTKDLMKEKCRYSNYKIINDSHDQINNYITDNIDFVVYNLGYLPNSKSKIKTNHNTTINSINEALKNLSKKGMIVIVAYTGHDKGIEKESIYNELANLSDNSFSVMNINLININNYPPELFIIQKTA